MYVCMHVWAELPDIKFIVGPVVLLLLYLKHFKTSWDCEVSNTQTSSNDSTTWQLIFVYSAHNS